MDKIIGLGNALVDVLATLKDDTLLDEMGLPKGSMQLIDDAKLQQINSEFSQMKTHLATGGSAGNAILGLACLGAGTGFIGKVGNDHYGEFFEKIFRKTILKTNYCSRNSCLPELRPLLFRRTGNVLSELIWGRPLL